MSKYSRDLKIIIANEFLSGESSEILSKKYAIFSRQIRYWSQVVAIHGDNFFQPTPHLRHAEARLQVLKLMWTNNRSLGHTSAVLNLSSPPDFYLFGLIDIIKKVSGGLNIVPEEDPV